MTLAPLPPQTLAPADLVRDFMAGLSKGTRATYSRSFKAFAVWAGQPDPAAACAWFLGLSPGEMNRTAATYRGAQLDAGLAPATVEVRISALRSLVRAGQLAGTHLAALSLPPLRSARVHKGRRLPGVTRAEVDRMLAVANLAEAAMLRLLSDRGFRVGTVAKLRRGDFDAATRTVMATGKGLAGQRDARTLAQVTADAVAAHLAASEGDPSAPMFGRVTSSCGVVRWIKVLADRAGVPRFKCHSLRALAITAALDATNGDVRAVQAFAAHSSPATTLRYDATWRDLAGEVARRVAGEPPT